MSYVTPEMQHSRPTNYGRVATGEFAGAIMKSTAGFIRSEQRKTAEDWNLFESGKLMRMLMGHFFVRDQDGGAKLSMSYLNYARWLDMRDPRRKIKREGYHLYNRIVFGVLYNRALPALQYGFSDQIKNAIGSKLNDIAQTPMPFYKKQDIIISEIAKTDRYLAALMAKSMRTGYK